VNLTYFGNSDSDASGSNLDRNYYVTRPTHPRICPGPVNNSYLCKCVTFVAITQKVEWHFIRILVDFFSDECDEGAVEECSAFRHRVPLSKEFDSKAFDLYCGCVP